MKRLTPEEIEQIVLIKETLWEIQGELYDISPEATIGILDHLRMGIVKCNVLLALNGAEDKAYPPAPPGDDVPF